LPPDLHTEGNFQALFSRRKSIGRVPETLSTHVEFSKISKIFENIENSSIGKFGGSVSCLGLYGGLYGQNLPYLYVDFQNRNFEKSHRTTVLNLVYLAARKSRTLEPLAFDEYCRFDTSGSAVTQPFLTKIPRLLPHTILKS
jgi:hypothetical protein